MRVICHDGRERMMCVTCHDLNPIIIDTLMSLSTHLIHADICKNIRYVKNPNFLP